MEQFINKVIQGDCLIKLKELEDNSIDSIVTDPPAGISFMGKSWDTDKGGRDNWIKWMQEVATECKRVLKPGGHAFVWAIPRTSHWTATAWENAGFEIRDVVAHVFGSGFPKSLNIGKAVDKLQGNEREGFKRTDGAGNKQDYLASDRTKSEAGVFGGDKQVFMDSKGTSEWEGWGTALKPAREDWILVRKPLDKGLTIAENCLKWGTGGINIDESRVGTGAKKWSEPKGGIWSESVDNGAKLEDNPLGRFPANLIHDNSEEVRECFPNVGNKSIPIRKTANSGGTGNVYTTTNDNIGNVVGYGDSGNASRFFKSIIYQAKASKRERGQGNNHPTVKSLKLMEYLIKMVTKPGGIVLDPFAGSGSTLVAAKQNGYKYIGIEITEEYIPIIEARLLGVENDLFKDTL